MYIQDYILSMYIYICKNVYHIYIYMSVYKYRSTYGYFRLIRARTERFDLRYDSGV